MHSTHEFLTIPNAVTSAWVQDNNLLIPIGSHGGGIKFAVPSWPESPNTSEWMASSRRRRDLAYEANPLIVVNRNPFSTHDLIFQAPHLWQSL